jgi:hypothetical protein
MCIVLLPPGGYPTAVNRYTISTWCNQTVSGLTASWHYCCQQELLPLDVNVVEHAKSFPAWNKVTTCAVVEQFLMDECMSFHLRFLHT